MLFHTFVFDLLIMEQEAFTVVSNRKLKNKKTRCKTFDYSNIQSAWLCI